MSVQREINRGYIEYLRDLDPSAPPSPSRQTNPPPENSIASKWLLSLSKSSPGLWKGLVLAALIACGVAIIVLVRVMSLFRRAEPGSLHDRALGNADQFLEQYPFHIYPLFAKCLELAYLHTQLPQVASPGTKVVELAIGDGTLSEKIYPRGTEIVAMDISPYSLRLPAALPHVKQAVIGDCVNPPIRSGSFDLLVTNNFVHHVTEKGATLDHFARISRRTLFNENTTFWASAWPGPFLLGRLGFKSRAKQITDTIEKYYLQSLLSKPELDALVNDRFNVISSEAYFSELTYFFATIFSRIMGCYGPPMPTPLKDMFLGQPSVKAIVIPLTRALTRALIHFDSHQDKSRAAFISYTCESRSFQATAASSDFICADCGTVLSADLRCGGCGREYHSFERMAFILPRELDFIRTHYSGQAAYDTGAVKQHH